MALSSKESYAKNLEPCSFILKGQIIDEHDFSALDYSTIYFEELKDGVVTDSLGNFQINLCPGRYTLKYSHVGCEPRDTIIDVRMNHPKIILYLEHHAEELAAALISGEKNASALSTEISSSIKQRDLKDPSKDLGQVISAVSGVNLLQTGPTIFKPILHGLHSDRLLILNNGTRLEGQSWGAEHAPEIDISSAQALSVVKGAGSVRYGTDAIAGVITVDLAPVNMDENWSGQVNTSFNSNSLGTALHGKINKGFSLKNSSLGMSMGSSYKRQGDSKAPDYVLSNTGLQEGAAFLNIGWQKKNDRAEWKSQTLYSFYHRKMGILSATHIGNLNDLAAAISSEQPTIIEPRTFKIGLPRQEVLHHLVKNVMTRTGKNGILKFQHDFQFDNRQEYDNRRGGRSETPALDMNLLVNHGGISYALKKKQHELSFGTDYYYRYNRNVPGTGFRVIIPNYVNNTFAIWALDQWKRKKLLLEAGIRYEFQHFAVYRFDQQKELQTPVFKYNNYAAVLGAKWDINQRLEFNSNLGLASRSPNANELFSQGVHQSAAAIEYGDSTLLPEKAIKWVNQIKIQHLNYIKMSVSPYINYTQNFIYLEPQNELELTIRGAFPVFRYKQTDVIISGVDADVNIYPLNNWWRMTAKYSFIRMLQVDNNEELVNTPPNRLSLATGFEKAAWKKLYNLYFNVEWSYVSRQERVNPDLDFAPPPSEYSLLSMDMSGEWLVKNRRMGAGIQVNNMLNNSYRDYLDRFRYFADAPGINFNTRIYFIF